MGFRKHSRQCNLGSMKRQHGAIHCHIDLMIPAIFNTNIIHFIIPYHVIHILENLQSIMITYL